MSDLTPKSVTSQKISTLFRRRFTTAWSPKEVAVFKRLKAAGAFEDLDLVIRYTLAERRKGDKGCHRRDLGTFLNQFTGEVDRAKGWEEKSQPRQPRPMAVNGSRVNATGHTIMTEPEPVLSEPEPVSEATKRFMADLEERKKRRAS